MIRSCRRPASRSPTASTWRSTRSCPTARPATASRRSCSSTAWRRTRGCGTASRRGSWSAATPPRPWTCAGTAAPRSPTAPYDMATVADDLATVIGALGWERPVVAGQSWGGNVVLELANRHPDATRGIVCVDGGWLEPCAAFDSWEACEARLAPPRLAGRRRKRDRGLHPRRARGLAGDRDRGDARQLRAAARRDDRAVAHVRPPHRGPARPLGPPPVGDLRRDRGRRCCSCRRRPGRTSG